MTIKLFYSYLYYTNLKKALLYIIFDNKLECFIKIGILNMNNERVQRNL